MRFASSQVQPLIIIGLTTDSLRPRVPGSKGRTFFRQILRLQLSAPKCPTSRVGTIRLLVGLRSVRFSNTLPPPALSGFGGGGLAWSKFAPIANPAKILIWNSAGVSPFQTVRHRIRHRPHFPASMAICKSGASSSSKLVQPVRARRPNSLPFPTAYYNQFRNEFALGRASASRARSFTWAICTFQVFRKQAPRKFGRRPVLPGTESGALLQVAASSSLRFSPLLSPASSASNIPAYNSGASGPFPPSHVASPSSSRRRRR